MVTKIGGTSANPGFNNTLLGTVESDILFGDPFTANNDFNTATASSVLASGRGCADTISGYGGEDQLFGDAWSIDGRGIGGKDLLYGGVGGDVIRGDASTIDASGGGDRIFGGSENDSIWGDAGGFIAG